MTHRLSMMALALLTVALVLAFQLLALSRRSTPATAIAVVRLTGLPDLSLANGYGHLRHRSLAWPAQLFGDHPELPGMGPAERVYAPAPFACRGVGRLK